MLKNNEQTVSNSTTDIPQIDFETIRETLAYMHDDVHSVKGVEHVAAALFEAIKQVELAQVRASGPELKIIRSARFPARIY